MVAVSSVVAIVAIVAVVTVVVLISAMDVPDALMNLVQLRADSSAKTDAAA